MLRDGHTPIYACASNERSPTCIYQALSDEIIILYYSGLITQDAQIMEHTVTTQDAQIVENTSNVSQLASYNNYSSLILLFIPRGKWSWSLSRNNLGVYNTGTQKEHCSTSPPHGTNYDLIVIGGGASHGTHQLTDDVLLWVVFHRPSSQKHCNRSISVIITRNNTIISAHL